LVSAAARSRGWVGADGEAAAAVGEGGVDGPVAADPARATHHEATPVHDGAARAGSCATHPAVLDVVGRDD